MTISVYLACGLAIVCSCALGQTTPGSTEIDRGAYADRLEGFWLAQCIANWTGLQTEGRRQEPPFYTDSDWPMTFDGRSLRFVTDQDPWQADDDTDIEYVYISLMREHATAQLSAEQIREGWIEHINEFIWVSNARARELMDRGVTPPATSLPSANTNYLRIDAQLTTEVFGVFAPGMPAFALELADLPIATTARGHAAHASQFFVALHSLAAARGVDALNADGIEQLVIEARAFIPDSSKSADIIDHVLADYHANPDPSNWERTRDLIADRYQLNDEANGFRYLNWFESSVNFGSAIVCLLYGQGDLLETIRIGTLTGWDSDNPTASMGGLIGLMLGADGVREAFMNETLGDRYWIDRTRDNMFDFLPVDDAAEDRFTLLAQRMLPLVDVCVGAEGGVANHAGWLIPPQPSVNQLIANPLSREGGRSANFLHHESGTPPTASTSLTTTPSLGPGSSRSIRFVNGLEHNPSGRDVLDPSMRLYFWSRGAEPDQSGEITLQVSYSQPVEAHTIRFIEGDHFNEGGWFDSMQVEIRSNAIWTSVPMTQSEQLSSSTPFQIIDFTLSTPVMIDAVRIRGIAGGVERFITVSELDVLSTPTARVHRGWDINDDMRVDVEDLHAFNRAPFDLNEDSFIDRLDAQELEHAVRWRELEILLHERR